MNVALGVDVGSPTLVDAPDTDPSNGPDVPDANDVSNVALNPTESGGPIVVWIEKHWLRLLRVEVPYLVATTCVIVLVLGVLTVIEPQDVLAERRSNAGWKIIPWLREQKWYQNSADRAQRAVFINDKSRTIFGYFRIFTLPITITSDLCIALLDFAVLRSIVLLTFVPFLILLLFSWGLTLTGLRPSPSSNSDGGGGGSWRSSVNLQTLTLSVGGPGLTWICTAIVLLLLFKFDPIRRRVVRWAVSDAPLGVYIVILALVLAFAAITTTLMTQALPNSDSKSSTLVDYQRTMGCTALGASVVAIWIIRLMNPRLFSRRACMGDV